MFSIALLVGIYSYLIYSLGLLGILYKENIFFLTLVFIVFSLIVFKPKFNFSINKKIPKLLFLLFIILMMVNLAGVLGPELGFDALWYHLTLPKIYLSMHRIVHIPGGLFYYSDMPKLIENLYISSISLIGESLAKLVHFSFGILSSFAVYKLSRKFLHPKFAFISALIFYSNLVVGWESITSYVDLARTFFEIMALWGFVNWRENKEKKWFIESAFCLGLAISTKLLSLSSLLIFLILILYFTKNLKNIIQYTAISLFVPLPYFLFSAIQTGNPVYPIFSSIYKMSVDLSLLNPLIFFRDLWLLFTRSQDPLSPIYIIFLPFIFLFFKRFNSELKLICIYSFISLFIWYITPRTGGGRFILPYLPALSIIAGAVIDKLQNYKLLKRLSIYSVIFVSLISIFYRSIVNSKYIPVLFGTESKDKFLSDNLNFSFGDFYDTDGYFKEHINASDKVLLYGFHNLYYIDFPLIDSSYVKKGDAFNYIATQNVELPNGFKFWKMIYSNEKTKVKLYSLQGQKWVY